jgi:hypothetical protein
MSSILFITLYNSCHGEKTYFHSQYIAVKLTEDKTRKGHCGETEEGEGK